MIFLPNPTLITGKIYQLLQITLWRLLRMLNLKKPGDIENPHIMSLKNSIVESLLK